MDIQFPKLHINIENLPKSFNFFGVDIAFYGCIIALVCYIAKTSGQDYNEYIDFALYAIIFSVIGARLYYVIFSWDYYGKHPNEILNIREGGLAIYGGVIAGVLVCLIYTRVKKLSFKKIADTAVYGLILGQIIGRWGNFFNREAFGGVAKDSSPLMMKIFFGDKYSISQVPDAVRQGMETLKGKTLSEIGYIQVQPTFLYESLWNLCVLILMLAFRKKKKFDGEILLWYLLGYGTGRAIIEGMRTDQLIMPVTRWPVSQALSIVVAAVALTIIIVKRVQIKRAQQ